MRAGLLRSRVTIQRASESVADDYNVTALAWSDIGTRWAHINPLSGQELLRAAQISAEVTHEIRMRWMAGLTAKDRIVFGARTFNIQSVLNRGERNIQAILLCKEET